MLLTTGTWNHSSKARVRKLLDTHVDHVHGDVLFPRDLFAALGEIRRADREKSVSGGHMLRVSRLWWREVSSTRQPLDKDNELGD